MLYIATENECMLGKVIRLGNGYGIIIVEKVEV